jgi:peroxiredoxin
MRNLSIALICLTLPLAAQSSLSGRRAPSFSLPDTSLAQHDILDYRGRWLLLDFMRTDCPHCVAVSKVLEQAQKQFGTKVAVLSIVIAPPETTTTVAKYELSNKLTSPIVFDQGQVAVAYFKATPATPGFDTPHLFVIDPNGKIVRDWADDDRTKEILEGAGLAKELQALMAAPAK